MPRRKQKQIVSPQTFAALLIGLGLLWLFGKMAENAPSGTGTILFLILLGLIAIPIVLLVRRVNARHALLLKVTTKTEQQLDALLRRRAQLVRLDPYGKPVDDKWRKEIDYFITQHVQTALNPSEQRSLTRNYQHVAEIIAERIESAQSVQPAFKRFSEGMSPSEFETYCAEQLRLAGWNARVTMQSRDQGVDVIAQKAGRRVVLQCKLYARPVGNKSVQEATAARAHEQADFGIVVSNNSFTDAAEQLARSNGIFLLHHRDLQNLDRILPRR